MYFSVHILFSAPRDLHLIFEITFFLSHIYSNHPFLLYHFSLSLSLPSLSLLSLSLCLSLSLSLSPFLSLFLYFIVYFIPSSLYFFPFISLLTMLGFTNSSSLGSFSTILIHLSLSVFYLPPLLSPPPPPFLHFIPPPLSVFSLNLILNMSHLKPSHNRIPSFLLLSSFLYFKPNFSTIIMSFNR